MDIDLFPRAGNDVGKSWGCPIIPLIHLGGSLDEHHTLPATDEIKNAISTTLRSAVVPITKRDLRTLSAAWTSLKESGLSKLKERQPDLMWPLWDRERDNRTQQGKPKYNVESKPGMQRLCLQHIHRALPGLGALNFFHLLNQPIEIYICAVLNCPSQFSDPLYFLF